VTKQADGTVRVTIRELINLAALQGRLRADGVPASVTGLGRQNPSCRPFPASPALMRRVFSPSFAYFPRRVRGLRPPCRRSWAWSSSC
jgi:hypothetical protein